MSEPLSDYISEIELMSQNMSMTYLLVEGMKDQSALRYFISEEHVSIQPTPQNEGKELVLECMKSPKVKENDNVIALLDADYDRLLGTLEKIDNVFYSETHDFDLDLFREGILKKIFDVIIEDKKVPEERVELYQDLIDKAMKKAYEFGLAKFVCIRAYHKLKVGGFLTDFERIPLLYPYCNRRRGESNIKLDRYIEDLQQIYSHINVLQETQEESEKGHSIDQIVRGHDVVFLLVFYSLPYVCKNWTQLSSSQMDDLIRIACSKEHLMLTQVYHDLTHWAQVNERIIFL